MGRASQSAAAENRVRVVAAAASMLRRKGVEGVGIDELMSEAGLTRGSFYKMFGTKEGLAAEGCSHAFQGAERNMAAAAEGETKNRLSRLVEFYFSPKEASGQCPMATLAGDAARAENGGKFRRAFTDGMRRLVALVAGERRNDRELVTMAAMLGALVIARASDDTDLSKEMQAAVLRFASQADGRDTD